MRGHMMIALFFLILMGAAGCNTADNGARPADTMSQGGGGGGGGY